MNYSERKTHFGLLLVLLISQMVSIYYIWVLFALLFVISVFLDRGKLTIYKMPGGVPYYVYLLFGIVLGLIGILTDNIATWAYIRDIIRISTIPLFWFWGNKISEKYNKESIYINVFAFCGIYSFIMLAVRVFNSLNGGGLYAFRSGGSINEYILAVGLYIAFFKAECVNEYYISKGIDWLIRAILLITFLSSFSRVAVVLFGCLILANGLRRMKTTARIIVLLLVGIGIVFMIAPELFSEYLAKVLRSFTEMSSTQSGWTDSAIISNWRGFEVDCAIRQFNDFSFGHKLLGTGFGSQINVLGYEYLVTSENGLAWTHNGYYTVLIKTGVIGVICVFCFLGSFLIGLILKRNNIPTYDRRLGIGIIIGIIVAALVMHGVFVTGISLWHMLLLASINREASS